MGPNGQLIEDLVPELRLIIGEQPPVPELPPQDAQRRFHLVFQRFLGVFARLEHPLALFLDDLQWLDAATLDLIEDLLTQSDLRHLLLIGAYRDNELDASHPLRRKLEAIRHAGATVQEITLAPLARDDLAQFIADALHCKPEQAGPLAQLVQEKTGGNPFFTVQFLSALLEEGLLVFDHGKREWTWDIERIHAKGYTNNIVELMVGKVRRLSAETQIVLQKLACLGNAAEVSTLALVCGTAEAQVHADLFEAVRAALVTPQEGSYRFIHDRVQEAAYSLIPEESRAETHLGIGRLLAAHTPPEEREEAIFEIVNQLNRGIALITSRDEREQLAELNLIAGKRAKASTAYASALTYLTTGVGLLADDAWERLHELRFALELHRAECEFVIAELALAEERLIVLSRRCADDKEHATVACLHIDLYTMMTQLERAVAVGLEYLRGVGIEWPLHPGKEDALGEYERIKSLLGSRSIEELMDLPLASDAAAVATIHVLVRMVPVALTLDPNLPCLLMCRAVSLILEHGNCDASPYAYAELATYLGPYFGDYRAGSRLAKLAYKLVERPGFRRFEARTYHVCGFVMAWSGHVRAARLVQRRAFEAANRAGDLTHAAFDCYHLNTNLLAAGDPLSEAQVEAENGFAFVRKIRFHFAVDVVATQLALIRTLRGLTPVFGVLDDAEFDERRIEIGGMPRTGIGRSENAGTGSANCRRAFLPATMQSHSTPRPEQNRSCGLHCHSLKRLSITFMQGFPTQPRGTLPPPANGKSTSKRWPHTVVRSRRGLSIARKTSRTALRWSGRRSLVSKTGCSMLWRFTSRLSARHRQTALSRTRRSPTNWRRASMRRVGSSRSRIYISETPATGMFAGEPTGRCGNSIGCIRTCRRTSQFPARSVRSGRRLNIWISRRLSRCRKPSQARSCWKSSSRRCCGQPSSKRARNGGC